MLIEEQIDLLTGNDLAAAMAETVFGLVPCQSEIHNPDHPDHQFGNYPCYASSGNPTAGQKADDYSGWPAFGDLIEHMHDTGWWFECDWEDEKPWAAFLTGRDNYGGIRSYGALGDTIPEAACRAALKAVISKNK